MTNYNQTPMFPVPESIYSWLRSSMRKQIPSLLETSTCFRTCTSAKAANTIWFASITPNSSVKSKSPMRKCKLLIKERAIPLLTYLGWSQSNKKKNKIRKISESRRINGRRAKNSSAKILLEHQRKLRFQTSTNSFSKKMIKKTKLSKTDT